MVRVAMLLPLLLLFASLSRASVLADSDPSAAVPAINPVELIVPAAGIDASVQDVGLASDGSMAVPSNFDDAAWYDLGFRPGEDGNAVFDGHVSSTDAAAVFFNVEDLQAGDLIQVVGDDGTVLSFQVSEVDSVPMDSAPMDQIVGSSGWPQVVLITCGGDWHPDVHLFDHRTIVYAPLIGVN